MIAACGIVIAFALGLGVWWLAAGRPHTGADGTALIGHSIVLGLLGVGFSVQLPSLFGMTALPDWRWLWPLPMLLLVWLAVLIQRRPVRAQVPREGFDPLPRGLLAIVLALIGLRLIWSVDEAWLRPLFGWDGWLAWSAKAKAWVESGEVVPFAPALVWLEEPDGSVRSSLAPMYPELLSWIEVWLAALVGGWREAGINLAWPLLWLALMAGSFGQWRILGASGTAAVLGLYGLASLPLLTVHAALPGYADMWVGTCLAFAILAWLRWMANGERGQLLLSLLLLAVLPALKFEGTVWALGVISLMFWFAVPHRSMAWRLACIGAGVVLVMLASWWLDLQWLNTVLHLLTPAPDGSSPSVLGVLLATAAGLFTQLNWHLLWYVLPVVVVWRWRALCAWPPLMGMAVFVVGGLFLLLGLFLFTHAGRWAESYTVVNRLVLHFAPTAVALLVLCFRAQPGVANRS